MANAKSRRAEQALVEALHVLLQHKQLSDISVSELARKANVSRSTFYVHFDNVADVFDKAVREGDPRTTSIGEGLGIVRYADKDKTPFCESLRCRGKRTAMMHDPHYLNALFSNNNLTGKRLYIDHLKRAGLSAYVAEAIYRFQLSGCYAAATANDYTDEEWTNCRTALDTFIRAGMEALGVHFEGSNTVSTSNR